MRFLANRVCASLCLHKKFYNTANSCIHLFRQYVSRIMGLTYA
jgi:hypothetical protein